MNKPIIFSAPMILALLAGRKVQTRRVLKLPHHNRLGQWEPTTVGGGGSFYRDGSPAPEMIAIWHTRTGDCICIPTQPEDVLWVRECFSIPHKFSVLRPSECAGPFWYWADGNPIDGGWTQPKPSIHMPRWASRLTLEVTGVKVERVQNISHKDATAEGVDASGPVAIVAFKVLWENIHGPGAWEKNPWIYAFTFTARKCNIDALEVSRE